MSDIVQKLWGFCHTLRHDGVDYGDYIEQITYLLFIEMADEHAIVLPNACDWPALPEKSGTALVEFYTDLLRKLGRQPGILGDIYAIGELEGAVDELNLVLALLENGNGAKA